MIRIAVVGYSSARKVMHELMHHGNFALLGSACYSGHLKRNGKTVEVQIVCMECPQCIPSVSPDWIVQDADWQSARKFLKIRNPRRGQPGVIRVKAKALEGKTNRARQKEEGESHSAERDAAHQLMAILLPDHRGRRLKVGQCRHYRHTVLSPG